MNLCKLIFQGLASAEGEPSQFGDFASSSVVYIFVLSQQEGLSLPEKDGSTQLLLGLALSVFCSPPGLRRNGHAQIQSHRAVSCYSCPVLSFF